MPENYEELLDIVLEQVPKAVFETSRFQVPEADISVAGNQTVLKNLRVITTALNREPEHLAKYLLRELAVAGVFKETQLVLQGKFPRGTVEEKIKRYIDEFVICKECKKPDTKLERLEKTTILRCEACGAKTSVRSV